MSSSSSGGGESDSSSSMMHSSLLMMLVEYNSIYSTVVSAQHNQHHCSNYWIFYLHRSAQLASCMQAHHLYLDSAEKSTWMAVVKAN